MNNLQQSGRLNCNFAKITLETPYFLVANSTSNQTFPSEKDGAICGIWNLTADDLNF